MQLATAEPNIIIGKEEHLLQKENKMSLTFEQIISAWSKCSNDKDPSEIEALLSSDFVWQSAAPDHKAPSDDKANKQETIEFTLGAGILISDFNTIYNGDEVVSGTHSAIIDGEEKAVFCVGFLTDDGTKVRQWRHLTGNYPGA